MSIFAVSFGGKHSGFLVSLIDVFGYSGALLFNYFGGSIAQHYGWSVFLGGLLTIAILATVFMIAFLTLDWNSARRLIRVCPAMIASYKPIQVVNANDSKQQRR